MQQLRSHEIFRDLKKAFKRSFEGGSECAFHAANYAMLKDRLLDVTDEQGPDEYDNAKRALTDEHVLFAVDELLEVLVVPMRVALDWAAEKCDTPEMMLLLRNVHGHDLWIWFSMYPESEKTYDGTIQLKVLHPTPLAAGLADRRGVDFTERFAEWRRPTKQKPKTKVKPKKRKTVSKDAEDV